MLVFIETHGCSKEQANALVETCKAWVAARPDGAGARLPFGRPESSPGHLMYSTGEDGPGCDADLVLDPKGRVVRIEFSWRG
jgi:hypothetical protein